MKYDHEFFKILRNLNLPLSNYAIFGSGPLFVRGIINQMNDLDVICRGDAWEMAKSIGEIQYLKKYDVTISSIMNNKITFGTQWGIGNPDINLLIDGAETMDGLPFVELKHVINYKLIRANKKDLNHIKLVINAGNKSQA